MTEETVQEVSWNDLDEAQKAEAYAALRTFTSLRQMKAEEPENFAVRVHKKVNALVKRQEDKWDELPDSAQVWMNDNTVRAEQKQDLILMDQVDHVFEPEPEPEPDPEFEAAEMDEDEGVDVAIVKDEVEPMEMEPADVKTAKGIRRHKHNGKNHSAGKEGKEGAGSLIQAKYESLLTEQENLNARLKDIAAALEDVSAARRLFGIDERAAPGTPLGKELDKPVSKAKGISVVRVKTKTWSRKARYPKEAKIHVLLKQNPHRPGTKNFELWKKYKEGMTMAEAKKAGLKSVYINYSIKEKHIDIRS